jgi:hypothetical protein
MASPDRRLILGFPAGVIIAEKQRPLHQPIATSP